MSTFNFAEGEVLLIDKPQDWTSFDVVAKVRNAIRIKKVGHAGTLDPMATGLLILCTGKKTKEIEQYMAAEKEYEGTMLFGATTPSYDAHSDIDQTFPLDGLNEDELREALKQFVGPIQQVPPAFSAIKIKGQRAYNLARKGKEVVLEPRSVEIKSFELTRVAFPEVDFRVVCSKGTYIRSLAHDLGKAVNNGAHLTRLVRTRIGQFQLENAWNLTTLVETIRDQKSDS
ncbi:MAG: tRNA pseudouridine(55) synthase TruB [Bacteroidota bacterium]|nr:tRNA pseudouridine(55) synthase TruB [Bacteroidota bacterium]MDX5429723.1 tRNA pseudouridine(55) synthase TruB [Bacteroidota bacterium]MDX5468504.1 tRNA pseudouridine(55) synthase TruB [Bacteroidota bacterium]